MGGKSGVCNVNQGIVSGADKVSKKHLVKFPTIGNIGDGIFVLDNDEVSSLDLNKSENKNIVKKLYKNSDISKYITKQNTDNNILYIEKKENEQGFMSLYPNIHKHMNKFKNLMTDIRGGQKENIKKWFALHRTRKAQIFTTKKIVAPQRSKTNTFGYNEIPWYASADVYFITNKPNHDIELKYILALLNSKLYYLWLYHRGKRKGEMLELYQKPLSEIPIKTISKQKQKPFEVLVDKIMNLKAQDQDTTELENEIDVMVYRLYGLGDDDIHTINKSTKL